VSARSLHPNGAQILLGDGSARLVTNNIDIQVWRALGSSRGGEAIGDY
jgi:prepilin-type processing-associated H-X9-DG protein